MSAVADSVGAPAPVLAGRRAAAGLRAFVRIAEAWSLTVDEPLHLLGQPPRSTFFVRRNHRDRGSLPRDTPKRLSKLLGISKSRQILLDARLCVRASAGLVYPSVRQTRAPHGQCVGLFTPQGAARCVHAAILLYAWDGRRFTDVYAKTA